MYKVVYQKRGKTFETEPLATLGQAERVATEIANFSKAVTITKQGDGSDHPANKGEYFLHRIVK